VIRLLLLSVTALCLLNGCKGHREFREARKNLKEVKAQREQTKSIANTEQETEQETEKESYTSFPDSLFFGLGKSHCFGRCPVYYVKLYRSGYATWYGEMNVERLGRYEARYSYALRDSIIRKAQDIGFMFFLDQYDNSLIMDLPASYYQLKIEDTPKNILCRVQCPEELYEFSKSVEAWLEELNWQPVSE
jgi:hypothetical protein